MTKETAFANPPRGHVAPLLYDAVNDQYIAQRATPWTYDDRLFEDLGLASALAGTNTVKSTAVPAGYVYVVERLSMANLTGNRGLVLLGFVIGATSYSMYGNPTPTAWQFDYIEGPITLKEGDQAFWTQTGCTAGDAIGASIIGYQMKVPS